MVHPRRPAFFPSTIFPLPITFLPTTVVAAALRLIVLDLPVDVSVAAKTSRTMMRALWWWWELWMETISSWERDYDDDSATSAR